MYECGKTGRQGLCKLCMSVVRLVYVNFVLQWLGNYLEERSLTRSTYMRVLLYNLRTPAIVCVLAHNTYMYAKLHYSFYTGTYKYASLLAFIK